MEGFGGLSFEDGGGSIEVGGWDLDAELAALDRRDAALSGAAADDDDAASPPANWREAIEADDGGEQAPEQFPTATPQRSRPLGGSGGSRGRDFLASLLGFMLHCQASSSCPWHAI